MAHLNAGNTLLPTMFAPTASVSRLSMRQSVAGTGMGTINENQRSASARTVGD